MSEAGSAVDVAELRAHVGRMLPAYMAPSLYMQLQALPLTASGKVNRRALPAPERAAEAVYVAPRTPTEEVLAGIWAQVLGVDRVGVESSFFDLGGHSLLAMQVISRANAQLLDHGTHVVAQLSETLTMDGRPRRTDEAIVLDIGPDGLIARVEVYLQKAYFVDDEPEIIRPA